MLPPGTRIGHRYVIERLLGQGGMSNLYVATDLTQGRAERVIKEMSARFPDPNEQKMAEQLFEREAQLLATLNHPHIPKVFDKFIFQGKYYLSMEYVKGEDLGKIITDRGTIEEKWAAAWGAQMATVLYYLHRQNPPIVFRDVKPSNIMITNEQVKLIDFGIARMFTPAKKGDTMRIGSPGYAPPEQYGGQSDPRSDIYALGVTLHHAVTGLDPTTSQTPFLIPPARTINPRVSAEMEAIITKATQLDADKRYQNCLDMKKDLQNVMRAHGMLVGGSVPFSTVATPATPAAAAPAAATAAAAPPPAAMPTAGPAPAPTAAPTPSAAPTPTPSPAPTATAAPPKPVKKKRRLGPVLALLMVVGAGVGVASAPPQWRDAAGEQLQNLLAQLHLPAAAPPVSDAQKVVLGGGPLPVAVEALGVDVLAGKATPEQVLDYQNALAYASGRPLRRLAVVAPKDLKAAAALVAWQRISWEETYREGAMVVISLESVEADWRGALRRALGEGLFREQKKADALLVFPPSTRPAGWESWFEEAPTLYWGGPTEKGDPQSAQVLPEVSLSSDLLKSLQLGPVVWLARETRPPAGLSATELGSGESLARLLKSNVKSLLVVDAEQLKGLNEWPKVGGLKLLTSYRPGQLPSSPPGLPAGFHLYALSQATPYSSDPAVPCFFGEPGLNAQVYDHASWAGTTLLGGARQTGLSWHTDRNVKVEPARWNLLEARNQHWCWVREEEAHP